MKIEGIAGVGLDLDLTYAVTQARSRDDLRAVAARFAATGEFSYWIYALAGPDTALTNYPAPLVSTYKQNRWHCGSDPLLDAIHRQHCSLSWDLNSPSWQKHHLDEMQRNVMERRQDLGVRAGVSAPAYARHGNAFEYAVVSFARDRPLSETAKRHNEPRVQLFATYFLSVAQYIFLKPHTPLDSGLALTQRERDCLTWVAGGKSSWEIGRVLGISEATVNFHLGNAATKLGVRGRVCAVARAMRLGLINPI
jgi:LuxR family quorum-sensing system transcriptional regulator CciR